MENIQTWEEMEQSEKWESYTTMAIQFAQAHVKAALEAVYEQNEEILDRNIIMNAYPLNLIK
jgi:hypothetical protein